MSRDIVDSLTSDWLQSGPTSFTMRNNIKNK